MRHQDRNTEGATTTARHTLHNKSKAISCVTRLAIPTRSSDTPEMHWSLRKVDGKDRECFPLQDIKPKSQG